jgi:hypothetical protein
MNTQNVVNTEDNPIYDYSIIHKADTIYVKRVRNRPYKGEISEYVCCKGENEIIGAVLDTESVANLLAQPDRFSIAIVDNTMRIIGTNVRV